ncbi:MAG: aminotransferase class III-fold pyridoxal phosphate-dependent enzyme, partial [bacterium]|nr:aminotransferase class III-fold pyridoxal phosphate-dependent enzyme [bacterium]
GVPAEFAKHTLLAPYNDLQAVEKLAKKNRRHLAAIIVEPVAGNMGLIKPKPGFLRGLKKICEKTGALLVFDEVMTGFRVHPQGAQGLYKIRPDLSAFGKILGGGLPVGAYGGSKKIMKYVSPTGGVYQAGTLSGNPLAMAAGITTLKILGRVGLYEKIFRKTERLAQGLQEAAKRAQLKVQVPHCGAMLSLFFSEQPVHNLSEVLKSQKKLFSKFFREMLARGVYLPPSPFEAWFVSLAHGENEIAKTLRAAGDSFQRI